MLITSRRSLKRPLQRNCVLVHFSTSCLQPVLLSKSFNHDNCCPSEYVNCDIFIQLQNIFTDHSRLSTTMKLVSSKYRTIIQKQPAILQHILAFGTPSPFKTYVRESFTAQTKWGGSLPYAFAFVAVYGLAIYLRQCHTTAHTQGGWYLLAPHPKGRKGSGQEPTRGFPSAKPLGWPRAETRRWRRPPPQPQRGTTAAGPNPGKSLNPPASSPINILP